MAKVTIPRFQGDAMQLSKLAREYTQYVVDQHGYSEKTREKYDGDFMRFVSFVLSTGLPDDVRSFTPDAVESFMARLREVGNTPNTIGNAVSALSSLAKYAMRKRASSGRGYLLQENPIDRVERPRRVRPERKFMHKLEFDNFRTVEAVPHEAIARDLFIDTWLRVSELCAANVEDLWLDQRERVILSVSVKGKGRSKEKVHIPLDPDVANRLVALIKEREAGPKDPLLVNTLGVRYRRQTLSEVMMRLARRAGITRLPVRPHAIRHTCNVIGRQNGLDPLTRSKLLNHSDPNTVARYDHLMPDETVEAREKFREALR